MAITLDVARMHSRNRTAGLLIAGIVALIVVGAGVYSVWLTNTTGNPPPLPAAPPRAALLNMQQQTDMLEGNFVLQTALYRSKDTPVAVIHYYRNLLAKHHPQIGEFVKQADTILPARAPEALQHMPAIFATATNKDSDAANYFYTEYSYDQSDVGVAVDARKPNGPTLVYLEMLTQPQS
jgi:hypothetical protein